MLPEGWCSSYSKEGETLIVWKFFPKHELNLEAEPRIKYVDIIKESFDAKGKDLDTLMKNAEKKCRTIEFKHRSQDQEDLLTKIIDIRRTELINKNGSHYDIVKDSSFVKQSPVDSTSNIKINKDNWFKRFNKIVINLWNLLH